MALHTSKQIQYWGIGMIVLLCAIWILGGVLLPFLVGMAIAYFLDPVADRLESIGASRVLATALITFVALLVFILALVVLIPQLIEQVSALVLAAPGYANQLIEVLTKRFPSIMEADSTLRNNIDGIMSNLSTYGGEFANTILASAFGVLDGIVFLVVAPVVAFYMLLDWDHMVEVIDGWLPRDHLQVMRDLAREVDQVLAGFVRGQLTVCAILGAFYAVALMAIGLQFGLVVGLIAGLLTFIPYVGSMIGGILSIGLALFQFWNEPQLIAVVAVVFVVGQMVEGNYLTPKLVGNSVGLHPVWLMFALSAFGTLFGFTGMLIAVPAAASMGVFFRFGIRQYTAGRLYQGHAGKQRDGEH